MADSLRFLNRRSFIKLGSSAVIYPFLFAGAGSCAGSAPVDWNGRAESADGTGTIRILQVEGSAKWGSKIVESGMEISSEQTLDLEEGSLVASLPDSSMVKLSKKASIAFSLDSEKGGVIHLKKGGMLAVVNKSRQKPYLIRTANAMVGVKGTVCYSHILTPEEMGAYSLSGKTGDYFCLCNGAIDFLDGEFDPLKSDKADYHSPYFILPGKSCPTIKPSKNLINHTDQEISDLIGLMKGPKHNKNWLFPGTNSYN
jgi:FecR-like protein